MRMGQGVRTGLGHGGITCDLQTQFSSCFFFGNTLGAFAVLLSTIFWQNEMEVFLQYF